MGIAKFHCARIDVSGFILVREGSFGHALWSPGFYWLAWVHLGAHRCRQVNLGSLAGQSGRVGVAGFIRFRLGSLLRS